MIMSMLWSWNSFSCSWVKGWPVTICIEKHLRKANLSFCILLNYVKPSFQHMSITVGFWGRLFAQNSLAVNVEIPLQSLHVSKQRCTLCAECSNREAASSLKVTLSLLLPQSTSNQPVVLTAWGRATASLFCHSTLQFTHRTKSWFFSLS